MTNTSTTSEEQPAVRGWLLAADANGEQIGLVPNNYVQIIGRRNFATDASQQRAMERSFTESLKESTSATKLVD